MSTIIRETNGAVAILKLNRPDKFNSFNREMALQLQKCLDDAAADDEVRAIYITGVGKAFCAGQDLAEATDPYGPGIKEIVTAHYNPIIHRIREIEKPVIAFYINYETDGVLFNYLPSKVSSPFKNIDFHADFVTAQKKALNEKIKNPRRKQRGIETPNT